MDKAIERDVHASAHVVFELAARVEDWPRILPHYRYVRVIDVTDDGQRTVEMGARRHVVGTFAVPLRWTALQWLYPDEPRITFEHIAGITRGMRVAWTFSRLPSGGTRVRIRHQFRPRWPVPSALVDAIVGDYFVNGVARRTLTIIGGLAEG
ncbi:MAG TPA: SRPBCC family protein [Chloroflexota bacterium]|nr:SRPBCC family protein [Chloroflexota bacterium]